MTGDLGETPLTGIYERLITHKLEQRLTDLEAAGWHSVRRNIGAESAARIVAAHVGDIVQRLLQGLSPADQVETANHVLDSLSSIEGAKQWIEMVADGPTQLLALAEQEAPGVHAMRPATPLSESALITNAPEDPNLGSELRAELATADRVDLLCAFVKWTGLRVLEQALTQAKARGVPIRVITTTYIGATERPALDRLVREFGAQVKINYELRSTRLHAKAWLFRRATGYDTAYVGSSNLSRSALLDGLEWNVRLSSVATPAVLKKFEATFDAYWSEPGFEAYDPDDADQQRRLDEVLRLARGGPSADGSSATRRISLSGLEVRPFPHQRDMLERLEVERKIHDRHRNLLVAATGTGKTVMAALDYKRLLHEHGRDLRLLFVAHRREILEQSMRTYQEVLVDAEFGEAYVGGASPARDEHVFASVQSLNSRSLDRYPPEHFDVIVIDEFHHGTAPTYRRIVDHFQPLELLGLTATPERMDGRNIQDEFFHGRIAAEMRLWEALENDLLSPFHYFGITDSTSLEDVAWTRGAYDETALSNLFTGNTARARLVIRALQDKLADPLTMRALGFCVSVPHAEFMAESFRTAGFEAVALSGRTPLEERRSALQRLKDGRIHVVFSVDLLNEGLDIPDVDTLLLLRPTQSATVFLQQLGRGLRRTQDKAVLTVLDFIGMHRKEFRFENQFRALTNLSRRRLLESVGDDFPQLPSGCQIILEPKAKERVLANIRSQLAVNVTQLAREVAAYAEPQLAAYLRESGRDIKEIYRGGNSWSGLLHRAGLIAQPPAEEERKLLKRMTAFLHVDDRDRADVYRLLLSDSPPRYGELGPVESAYARMLFFTLWPLGGGFATYEEGFDSVRPFAAFRSEARQVLGHALDLADHLPVPLLGELGRLPLRIHCSYSREEILTALGESHVGGKQMPGTFQSGVRWCAGIRSDALLITLEKDEKDFSPSTRYRDYALNERLFHWESQSTTSDTSPTGRRYQSHVAEGTHILPFVRRYKNTDIGGPQPWMFLGPAEYVEHRGSRPMAITWKLRHQLPADVWTYSAIAAG